MRYKLVLLFLALAYVVPTLGFAQTTSEAVTRLDVTMNVETSGHVNVTETIVYNFGYEQHHGIYRTIPYKYKARGGNYTLRLDNISVSKNGEPVKYETSREDDTLKLKIGDANNYVTGQQTYMIDYTVDRAINYFADHDELYWNAVGTAWDVPVLAATVAVNVPGGVDTPNLTCFTGTAGTIGRDCATVTNGGSVAFATTRPLEANEGLTIVTTINKGVIAEPTTQQQVWQAIRDNLILGLPLIVLMAMFLVWRRYGKDPKTNATIVAQYDAPDGLSPLAVGVLVDYTANKQDISAEIIYLATQGYIHINRIETTKMLLFKGTDYKIKKLKEAGADLSTAGKILFDALFTNWDIIKLSDLQRNRTFGQQIVEAKTKTTKELVTNGYFPRNPHILRGLFIVIGGVVAIWGTISAATTFGLYGGIATVVSAAIIIIFGVLMPTRTVKGAETRNHILGLKEYMNVAEKDRLYFHNAPEKNPQLFEKLLPFAIALGVDKAWSKQFEGIFTTNPSWYSDSSGHVFSAYAFSSSVGDFSSSLNSAVGSSTTASSGGSGVGGSSGGGFGGGGGGSW